MKKLYTLILTTGFGVAVSAQSYDLSLATDNYSTLESTSDDPLELDFTVTNIGSTTIPTGDSIYMAVTDGSNYWSTNTLAAGYVTYVILPSDMAPTDAFQIDVETITMQWVYDNIGLTGNVCVTILGVNINAAAPPTMETPLNDGNCVDYTVTAVAGAEEVGMSHFSVYPNPANTFVQFKVGNNDVTHVDIFDITGKLITTVLLNNSIEEVNVENFENGVYFYRIMNDEAVVKSDKFVVQK